MFSSLMMEFIRMKWFKVFSATVHVSSRSLSFRPVQGRSRRMIKTQHALTRRKKRTKKKKNPRAKDRTKSNPQIVDELQRVSLIVSQVIQLHCRFSFFLLSRFFYWIHWSPIPTQGEIWENCLTPGWNRKLLFSGQTGRRRVLVIAKTMEYGMHSETFYSWSSATNVLLFDVWRI
jgi:hypothetical protein